MISAVVMPMTIVSVSVVVAQLLPVWRKGLAINRNSMLKVRTHSISIDVSYLALGRFVVDGVRLIFFVRFLAVFLDEGGRRGAGNGRLGEPIFP